MNLIKIGYIASATYVLHLSRRMKIDDFKMSIMDVEERCRIGHMLDVYEEQININIYIDIHICTYIRICIVSYNISHN